MRAVTSKRLVSTVAALVAAGLLVASPGAGVPGIASLPGVDAATGRGWFAHPRPLAALLLVADARSDARLLREAIALLRDAGVSVLLLAGTATAVGDGRAPGRLAEAWADLRRRGAGLPLALAGHGRGAMLATQLADSLEPPQRPQLLWLLAPGVAATDGAGPPRAVDAALARVDGLCNGRVERVTRVWLMHGTAELTSGASRTQALADASPAATLFRVPGAGSDDLLALADTRRQLLRLLSGWIHQVRAARSAWRQ